MARQIFVEPKAENEEEKQQSETWGKENSATEGEESTEASGDEAGTGETEAAPEGGDTA